MYENEILELRAEGKTRKKIATQLGLNEIKHLNYF
jgi:DNA-binding CsgD family transcriptional regulator